MLETIEQHQVSDQLIVKESKLNPSTIKISGYRHSSNLLLAAAIVTPSSISLENIPDLLDTTVMMEILQLLGADCEFNKRTSMVSINTKNLSNYVVPNHLSKQLHGSQYLMPALLARFGKCSFGESGGCQIGEKKAGFKRPINHILDVMKRFAAKITDDGSQISAEATVLKAPIIDIMDYSYAKEEVIGPLTSGATKTAIILALAVKEGKTVLLNPFLKSETIDLLDFVKKLGYSVRYDASKIEIEYAKPKMKVLHKVISDPSEIITYTSISAFHGIQLRLTNITLERTWPILKPELDLLHQIGISYEIEQSIVLIKPGKELNPQNIIISVKGVCTDHHPLLVAILLKAGGVSHLREQVWHDRFNYVDEVNKFGLNLIQDGNSIKIEPGLIQAAKASINCPDLRAAALLLIIALAAPGKTLVINYNHLFRGYVNLIQNLQSMGAQIEIKK